MANISSLGIGSGIDVPTIVDELINAQREPAELRFTTQEVELQATLSSVGLLKGALDDLRSSLLDLKLTGTFSARSATSGDEELFTATANGDAVAGSYSVEVVNLAKAHKVITAGISDAAVGTGTLTVSVGSSSFNVTIDSSNNSLNGISAAINEAAGSAGLAASVLTVDDGAGGTIDKLVLTGKDTGEDNAISVTVDDTGDNEDTDDQGLSRLFFQDKDTGQMEEIDAAQDATVKIDQQTIKSTTNTISDVISGVTLTLLKETETPGDTTSLAVERDNTAAVNAVNAFVEKFNDLASLTGELEKFDPQTGESGVLLGDPTLRGISNQVRRVLGDSVSGLAGPVRTLSDAGISFQRDGSLAVDADKLTTALEDPNADVEALFKSEDGIATRLDSVLDSFLDFDGLLDSRVDGINDRLEDINEQRATLDDRMTSLEERLIAQFTAMDKIVAGLRAESDFLLQQLSSIQTPGDSSKK